MKFDDKLIKLSREYKNVGENMDNLVFLLVIEELFGFAKDKQMREEFAQLIKKWKGIVSNRKLIKRR